MKLSGETVDWAEAMSPLGALSVGSTARGLCHVGFGGAADLRKEVLKARPRAVIVEDGDRARACLQDILALLEDPRRPYEGPLDILGTGFQTAVWTALRDIPAGERRTYSDLARHVGAPTAVRAVAGACAANRLAVVIPCHRVVRSTGDISGYRWGRSVKAALLAREAR